MADPGPDVLVEQQRLRKQIRDHEARIEGYKLEAVEAGSRIRQALANMAATEKAIADATKSLDAMVKAHGEAVVNVDKLKKEVGNG